MNAPLRKTWTQDEFLSWAATQEARYEFDGSQPVAMTGGTITHNRLIRNLHFALHARLRGGPCEPLGPEAGIATLNDAIRYPDGLVTCSEVSGEARLVPGVVVVFEVISPGSGRMDRIVKVREYAAVPSIRRYVILESSSAGLTVFERSGPDEIWRAATLTKDDSLDMPEIGIEIPVAEFYETIAFGEEGEASD
jgi:Uma2 family endonuclease